MEVESFPWERFPSIREFLWNCFIRQSLYKQFKVSGCVGILYRNGSKHNVIIQVEGTFSVPGDHVFCIAFNQCDMGCNTCLYGKPCIQKDASNKIVPKIKGADCVVFASPLYFWTVSSRIKTFIERFHGIAQENPAIQTENLRLTKTAICRRHMSL